VCTRARGTQDFEHLSGFRNIYCPKKLPRCSKVAVRAPFLSTLLGMAEFCGFLKMLSRKVRKADEHLPLRK
jgi:hypothetical protein